MSQHYKTLVPVFNYFASISRPGPGFTVGVRRSHSAIVVGAQVGIVFCVCVCVCVPGRGGSHPHRFARNLRARFVSCA